MDEHKKNTENRIILMIAMVLGALVIGAVTGVLSFVYYGGIEVLQGDTKNTARIYQKLEPTATTTELQDGGIQDLSGIVDSVMPSIVAIQCVTTTTYYDFFFRPYNQEVEGSGSGILFDQNGEELLIMTNNHVVAGAKSIRITFSDGNVTEGRIKGTESGADLAIVAVNLSDVPEETLDVIRMATLGDSKTCKVGQMVLAIGNALGYGQSVTVGYISALDRKVSVEDRTMELLQTDAAINPGNSGGALINMKGEVVGINSAKYSATAVERMGYAIPMQVALPILDDLKGREAVGESEQGYLGVYYEEVSDEMNQIYQVPFGLYISEVIEGSAAEKAGIYSGDVIIGIDGRMLQTAEELQDYMKTRRIGDEVTVHIMRFRRGGYIEQEIRVVLGKRPES